MTGLCSTCGNWARIEEIGTEPAKHHPNCPDRGRVAAEAVGCVWESQPAQAKYEWNVIYDAVKAE